MIFFLSGINKSYNKREQQIGSEGTQRIKELGAMESQWHMHQSETVQEKEKKESNIFLRFHIRTYHPNRPKNR